MFSQRYFSANFFKNAAFIKKIKAEQVQTAVPTFDYEKNRRISDELLTILLYSAKY